MHLCLENHSKNLVALWQGKYKDMGEGKEMYHIPNKIWEKIGEETTVSSAMILSTFGCCTPNIWTQKHQFTAEDWSFWMIHLAPFILKGHFNRLKYYKHFMKWNSILK